MIIAMPCALRKETVYFAQLDDYWKEVTGKEFFSDFFYEGAEINGRRESFIPFRADNTYSLAISSISKEELIETVQELLEK